MQTARRRRPLPLQTQINSRRRAMVMVALALGAFGIGTTEFVSMGLLSMIADDFGITENTAGHAISAYALGVVVGAPIITAVTGKMPRRRLLLILMGAFTLGNALSVVAGSYPILLAARFIAGLPHGAYFSVAGLVAASMAPEGKRGKSVALVGMGLSVATVFGVPAAQALGAALGWHAAYVLVACIGIATATSLWFLLPHMTEMPATSVRTELGAFKRSQVWLTLAMGTVGFGGMFAIYTYISWTMTTHAGMDPSSMWIVLMAYGIGNVAGAYFGGVLSDRSLEKGILFSLVMIAVSLVCFYFTSSSAVLGTINFGVVGFFGSSLTPTLQVRLMHVAGDAQTLAAALNHSALNLANASGAALGGAVVGAGFSYQAPALAGAGLAIASIGVWFVTMALKPRGRGKSTSRASVVQTES